MALLSLCGVLGHHEVEEEEKKPRLDLVKALSHSQEKRTSPESTGSPPDSDEGETENTEVGPRDLRVVSKQ